MITFLPAWLNWVFEILGISCFIVFLIIVFLMWVYSRSIVYVDDYQCPSQYPAPYLEPDYGDE